MATVVRHLIRILRLMTMVMYHSGNRNPPTHSIRQSQTVTLNNEDILTAPWSMEERAAVLMSLLATPLRFPSLQTWPPKPTTESLNTPPPPSHPNCFFASSGTSAFVAGNSGGHCMFLSCLRRPPPSPPPYTPPLKLTNCCFTFSASSTSLIGNG